MMAYLEYMPMPPSDGANRTQENKTETSVTDGGQDVAGFGHFRLE